MIAGVWIEGHYLATQVALTNNGEILRDRIGEQKDILVTCSCFSVPTAPTVMSTGPCTV
jgi:hypothetical protein